MNFLDVTQFLEFFLKEENWIVQVLVTVFLILIVNELQKRFFPTLIKKFKKKKTILRYALICAIRDPITVLIWILGVSFLVNIIKNQTDASIFAVTDLIYTVSVMLTIVWFLIRFIAESESILLKKKLQNDAEFHQTTVSAIAKLLRVAVIMMGGLVILQTLGYSISGLLAFGGMGSIAVGFAARDLLANFLGGVTISMDRPFEVGEVIRSPDREIEGTVEKIGWRSTTIRTFDQRPLYVPNAIFTTISVENVSRMRNRRIKETIGIRYDDVGKMRHIVADVREMLQQHEGIEKDQRLLTVTFDEFADSSLNFFIYTFTKTTDWSEFYAVKEDILLKVMNIIESHGAECAFPTSTVHIPEKLTVSSSSGN